MNVILIGYRASGKTSVGKLLAEQLWKTFVDTDIETRKRHFDGATIADIFQQRGEPAWRAAEAAVMADYLQLDNHVLALGGGTPIIPSVREALKNDTNSRRIYLRCDPEELNRRASADPDSAASRPNLTQLGGGVAEIRALLEKREPVYREVADVEFDVTHVAVADTVRYLIQKFL